MTTSLLSTNLGIPSVRPRRTLKALEIEVLQLLPEGLTNSKIAAWMFLSLSTVKVHTRNIYGKQGVNNRIQAAAQGRDLGILPPT